MTTHSIDELTRHCGIASEFLDFNRQPTLIPREARADILACMGFEATEEGASAALAQLSQDEWSRVLPPIIIAREGEVPGFQINLPAAQIGAEIICTVRLEEGGILEQRFSPEALEIIKRHETGGQLYIRASMTLALEVPPGHHRLALATPGADRELAEAPLMIAQQMCYEPEPLRSGGKIFGTTMQLYTLRSERNWGMGDFTDLRDFIVAAAPRGIDIVGLNPLHALFPANPLHFSPYSPSNRAFLNVMYIDPEAVPEFAACEAVRQRVTDAEFQRSLAELRATHNVDYARVAVHKLEILELLFERFTSYELPNDTQRALAYRGFLEEQGAGLRAHATYDALHEYLSGQDSELWGWPVWPTEFRDPDSEGVADFVEQHRQRIEYFQYLQWCAFEQLRNAQQVAVDAGMAVGVYLDLAVGVAGSGSEVWSNQHLFCLNSSAGAPPDELAREGQDWGFPPYDPVALKHDAYQLFIHNLVSSMSCAGAVRFDHCVSLMRLWWVPRGASALNGGYVKFPLQDILAVLALESWRNECLVIGEDLGTVPDELKKVMLENHLYSYRVLYFEKQEASGEMIKPQNYPGRAVATVSTHDLPTLASWWDQSDIDIRAELKLLGSEALISRLRVARDKDKQSLLDALHGCGLLAKPLRAETLPVMTETLNEAVHLYLASSNSSVMIAQLEDWLGMLEPVNIPGTHEQHANWQRKMTAPVEGFFDLPFVESICNKISYMRDKSKADSRNCEVARQHAIPGAVEFVSGAGGFTNVKLTSAQGSALVSPYGGQVLGYQPTGATTDVLFLSDHAVFQAGKAIRGGVPLCWPWFGPDPEGLKRPNHGFARTSLWRVVATEATDGDSAGRARITLGLRDDAASHQLWPHGFDLQLIITLDDKLTLELVTRNTGGDAFTISQALHTYFRVGDIDEVEVTGLEDTAYLDKVNDGRRQRQQGVVRFAKEVDRIYNGVVKPLVIRDASLQRNIEVTATGGTTAIVWNPWQEASSKMADLAATDYQRFVCVETANAGQELVELAPGGEHRLTACYRVDALS